MRSTYNIKDAREDLKLLNDFLVELGQDVQRNQADFTKVEALLADPEFSRLMANVRYFQVEGFQFLADIYASKAEHFAEKAKK